MEHFKEAKELGVYSTRYLCDILHDMRKCYETRNFSYLPGLIEEAQYRAYRMENKLEVIDDIRNNERRRIELKEEIKELRNKKKELE
jgi:hypothetical protein